MPFSEPCLEEGALQRLDLAQIRPTVAQSAEERRQEPL